MFLKYPRYRLIHLYQMCPLNLHYLLSLHYLLNLLILNYLLILLILMFLLLQMILKNLRNQKCLVHLDLLDRHQFHRYQMYLMILNYRSNLRSLLNLHYLLTLLNLHYLLTLLTLHYLLNL